MKHSYFANFFSVVVLLLSGATAFGQAPGALKAAPKAGVMIEPVEGKGGPEAKFTNRTADDLAITYDKDKFVLKSGGTMTLPIPKKQAFDLKIFEKRSNDGQLLQRFESKATPRLQRRFIPFPWAKPNKDKEAQQGAQ